ncbi:uncharacterized protein LOC109833409 isoform X2 [Asparagus officinalis]|uniref:uncharacterized protein LOC109833409 isoform X2 n=1 Tax=Asparagus officinalis TaxID=4686 RepID=UPI00098E55B7|nr:uncharacterized protein LOC109833409 isoform X2 [Asparagus officinalis]
MHFFHQENSSPLRVWMCKPLSEDEFYDAIKDNYYTQNKFHFGLSHDQVFKLVQFFHEKRINVKQYRKPGIPNEIIKHFEENLECKFRVTGCDVSQKLESDEYSGDDGRDSQSYLGLSGSNTNRSKSSQKLTRKQLSFVDDGRGLYQMDPAIGAKSHGWSHYESKPSYLKRSTSPNDPRSSNNFAKCLMYDHRDYHGPQGSGREITYSTLGIDKSLLPQEPISDVNSTMDMQSHQFNSQLPSTHLGPSPLYLRPPNLMGSSFPICNPPNASLSCVHSEGLFNFHDYKHVSHSERYDPSNPRISFPSGILMSKGNEMLSSVHPTNSHGYTEASGEEFELGGQSCGNVNSPDYIPFPVSNCFNKNLASSYSNSSWKDTSNIYSSESTEDDDSEGIKPYLASRGEARYPKFKKSRLRSDTEQSRTSVFSRLTKVSDTRRLSGFHLSKAPQARHLSKRQKAFKYGTQEPVVSPSQDYHATSLSQREEQLIEVTEVSKQRDKFDDDEMFAPPAAREGNMRTSGKLEISNDEINEEAITENEIEKSEHLFLNFKRRSEIRRLSCENRSNRFSDDGLDEETPQKCKRRKLLRPSFSQEEHQDFQAATRETVGFKTVIENSELSPLNHLHTKNKKSPASVTDVHDVEVALEKRDYTSEASRATQVDSEKKKRAAAEGFLGDGISDKMDKASEVQRNTQFDVENKKHPASVIDLNVVASEKRYKSSEALRTTQLIAEKKNHAAAEGGLGDLASDKTDITSETFRSTKLDVDYKNHPAAEGGFGDVASDKTSEALRNTHFDAEKKNYTTAEGGLGNVVSYKKENCSESLTAHKKEVSNRNLRWFLKKSVGGSSKESNGRQVNEKIKDENHTVTEAPDLLADSKHGD